MTSRNIARIVSRWVVTWLQVPKRSHTVTHVTNQHLLLNGHAVRVIRELRGIRQNQLAESVGKSRSYVANIEAGRKKPGGDVALQIAEQLHVPLAAIAYRKTEEPAA